MNLKFAILLPATLCLAGAVLAQTDKTPGGLNPLPGTQKKEVDIGALEAPFSVQERESLAKAVSSHVYSAERLVIDQAMREHPNSRPLWIVLGRVAYLEKQLPDAADAFEHADNLKALTDDDRMTLALAYEFTNRGDKARTELQKITKAAPDSKPEAWYLLGRVCQHGKHYDEAVAAYRKSIDINPNALRTYEDLARTQEEMGRPADARATYEKANFRNQIDAHPGPIPPVDLAVFRIKAGDFKDVDKLLLEALRYSPGFPPAHYYLGTVWLKQGKAAQASTEFKAAIAADPRNRDAWKGLAEAAAKAGNRTDKEQAEQVLSRMDNAKAAAPGKK